MPRLIEKKKKPAKKKIAVKRKTKPRKNVRETIAKIIKKGLRKSKAEQKNSPLQDLTNQIIAKAYGDNLKIQVLELPPAMRTIFIREFHAFTGRAEDTEYHLSFPYLQFFRIAGSCFVTCSKKPITSGTDYLHYLPMPNAGGINEPVCMRGVRPTAPISDFIKKYFQTVFNDTHHTRVEFPQGIKHFRHWEKMSAVNPNFWQEVNWSRKETLNNFINYNVY